jgi:branched-chain amino acid transport system ATP-binding protein
MLDIQNLVVTRGGVRVLNGLDLSLNERSITALMGRNGAGKSTLCRAILGLLPSSGEVRLGKTPIAGLETHRIARHGVGYVPQGREIFGRLTVEENLRLACPRDGAFPPEVFAWFPALAALRERRAGVLSGGEQQMLATARALTARPRLLVLDEPSEGLQPSAVTAIAATLQQVVEEWGITVLLVEQNLDLVRRAAGRCAFLMGGNVAETVEGPEVGPESTAVHQYLGF